MSRASVKKVIGWKEWVSLPDFEVSHILAKIDSGALTSSLHAEEIVIQRGASGKKYVHFTIDPDKSSRNPIRLRAPLVEQRWVKSSIGHATLRPVVHTRLRLGNMEWSIEMTLVDREPMEHRMLIGRKAIRKGFLIDPGRTHLVQEVRLKKGQK